MSVGIIGGADGPTRIFVSSPTEIVCLIVGAIVVIAVVAGFVARKRKSKRKNK